MFIISTHIVPQMQGNIRLQDYCINIFNEYIPSRKGIKKAIKRNEILVNSNISTTAYFVQQGDQITLIDLENNPPKPYNLNFETVYQDDHFAIINKPAGISVSGNQYRTIQNAIIGKILPPDLPDTLKWPRPVHRLDNQTSGLLIIAKTSTTLMKFGQMFQSNLIQKEYHALVMGNTPDNGIINFPVDHKPAETKYQKLDEVPSLRNETTTLLKLSPQTGRTHQLRIHCAASGFPILGDKLYGPEGQTLLHKGLFLCATKLEFDHPVTTQPVMVEIDIPQKFVSYLEKEKRRWEKFNTNTK